MKRMAWQMEPTEGAVKFKTDHCNVQITATLVGCRWNLSLLQFDWDYDSPAPKTETLAVMPEDLDNEATALANAYLIHLQKYLK